MGFAVILTLNFWGGSVDSFEEVVVGQIYFSTQLILAEIDSMTQFQNLRKLLSAFESDCDTFH